ncbi:CPBP family intramembrane glutamic endopeptidase [Oceanicoccus sp. KOV_DT_Chl]|uniref:CPBP family intramembrane glutamic endopeptidase n=1 Tax=Oceanicoccus sp. KOV_DT_Chl TaxID=1904639 RepID=UPI000C7A048D|nr:CPBP family intramembrane glutamic endopeptidase [Oceanicoccus sp. KOV_DT_Chl]
MTAIETERAFAPKSYAFVIYILLAYGFTWLLTVPLMLSIRGVISIQLPHSLEMLAAFGPMLAALVVCRHYAGAEGVYQLLRGFGRWRVGGYWLIFSIVSPFFLLGFAAMIVGVSSGSFPDFASTGVLQLLTLAGLYKIVVVTGLVQGVGEEPGWRGLALPFLRGRYGPIVASLILFPIWFFWHLPMFLSRPEFGVAQFLGFALGILSATIWLTLLWDKTQSILIAVLWHTLINIARNIALAVSPALFMTINVTVLLGAILIVIYWIFYAKAANSGVS